MASTSIWFDEQGRDANGLKCCPACSYPHRAFDCDNPGCEANPAVSEAQKQRWRAEREKRAAEEVERDRVRSIRDRAWREMYPSSKGAGR